MAIQVITNFNVNAPAPVDERSVVDDITSRNNIEYKFAGLKTFVLSEGITYVYGTDSVWRPDGGSNGGGNGIYGGSGSLPGDVSVFLGTVSNSLNDRSNYLHYESQGLTDGDKNSLYTYAYRRTNGSDYDSMSFRTEQKLTPFGSSTQQGPYIEYNSTSPVGNIAGNLVLGIPNSNFTSRLSRIETNSYHTAVFPSEVDNDIPFAFSKISGRGIFGYNVSSYSPAETYRFQPDSAGYRMSFGILSPDYTWDFQTLLEDDFSGGIDWQTVISLSNKSKLNLISSPVLLSVDTSSRDWDGNSTRTPSLLTPQQIVRDIEHKYSKTQMWAAGTSNIIQNNILYLNTDGNSFEVTLTNNQFIKDILAYKTNTFRPDFPNGTIITIKFINSDSANPGYLKIHDGSVRSDSKIKSDLTDSTFEKNDNARLTIDHANTTDKNGFKNGEVITFRKFNQGSSQWWEIVNVSRERKIVTRNWTTGTTTTEWNFLSTVRWLTATSASGTFQNYGSTNFTNPITSLEHPYNKFAPPAATTTGVGASREVLNSDGFAFRISVDGNRIVFAQGNFRIDIKDTVYLNSGGSVIKKIYWSSYDQDRINIWAIGKISNVSLIPQWESVWSPVQVYARGEYSGNQIYRFEVINPVISINRLGDILLSFRAEPSYNVNLATFMQNMNMEVWVPPFSYTAATGSYPTTTGGVGGGNPPGGV